MADHTYLNTEVIRKEARQFFEDDFSEIPKFQTNSNGEFIRDEKGEKKLTEIYKQYFDSYRHTYGSAVLTREFGEAAASFLGDANEFDLFGMRNNPPAEKNQDLWNNAIGREIGKTNFTGRAIADQIKNAFENNLLIVDEVTDTRVYKPSTTSELFSLSNTNLNYTPTPGTSPSDVRQKAIDLITSINQPSLIQDKINKLTVNNATNPSLTKSEFVYNKSIVEKNFTSLGIDQSQFNFSQNTFAGHTFIDTSLSFNLTNTFASYSYSDSSSGSNNTDYTYNNFKNLNFTLSNPIKDALNHLGKARNHASPLAIDLDNDGIETTHLSEGNVFFDIKNSGFANRVGWIKADDGILALDRSTIGANGEVIAANGTIDNVTELFGDYRMSAWDELKLLDTNYNNKIDSGDEQFNNLKIWQDLNQNGISEAAELKSLSEHNIKEINLANITTTDIYQKENYISGNSGVTYEGATNSTSDDVTKQSIYDIHFLNDNTNTWFKGSQSEQWGNSFKIKLEALLLPLSRGYGELPSLHIAMSKDDTLLQLVTEFSTLSPSQLTNIPTLLENILYRWAGVDNIDPTSVSEADGSNIDARKLRFIEKFSGVTWEQLGNRDIVGHFASLDIKKAWDGIFEEMLNRFTTQGPLAEIFQEASYDFVTDKITLGTDYQTIKARIAEFVTNNNLQNQDFSTLLSHIIYANKADLNLNFTELNTDLT